MNKIKLSEKYYYSFGNLSYGVILQIISSFFVFYATSVLHISGILTGFLVFLSVVWDAVTDPIMGYMSDNTVSKKYGKRHGYLIIGIIGLALSNCLLWSLRPEYNSLYKTVGLFTYMWSCKTFITIFATPYTALGAELTKDYNERTSIQTIKSAFFLIGIALPTVLGVLVFFRPTVNYPLGQLNPNAYLPMGIATSVLSIICAIPCIIKTKKYKIVGKSSYEKFNIKNVLTDMADPLKIKECRNVIFGYLWQNIATAIVMTLNLHVFTYTFYLSNTNVAIISGSLILSSVLSQAYWFKRTVEKDKKHAMLESIGIALFGSLLFFFLVVFKQYVLGKGFVFIPFAIIVGFAMGGMVSIPQTMLIDTIDLDEYLSGKRKEGSMFGCMTFFYKLSQSATIFLTGIFLDIIGFNASAGMQTPKVSYMLGFSLPISLVITLGLTFYYFNKYSLNREKVLEIQQKLAEKTHE